MCFADAINQRTVGSSGSSAERFGDSEPKRIVAVVSLELSDEPWISRKEGGKEVVRGGCRRAIE